MFRRCLFTLTVVAITAAIPSSVATQVNQSDADTDVIAVERASLDRWAKGDPDGFLSNYATEVTYFSPAEERRVDGLQAMNALLAPVRGKIRIDRYEMLNTKVQRHGDVAVLTYQIVNYRKEPSGKEQPTTRWNSTAVFHRVAGRWREIHSHFSFTKPEVK
jgi:ketosteroid isomerase-like protein